MMKLCRYKDFAAMRLIRSPSPNWEGAKILRIRCKNRFMIIAICSLKPVEGSPAEVVPATLRALEDRKTLGLFDFRTVNISKAHSRGGAPTMAKQ